MPPRQLGAQPLSRVRGFYLAKHLCRIGLTARFAQFPAPGVHCRALVCSEYQQEMDWFERYLAGPISEMYVAERTRAAIGL